MNHLLIFSIFLFSFNGVVYSRPPTFKNNDINVDPQGNIKFEGPASSKRSDVEAPFLFFEAKMQPNVLSFDQDIVEIDSIQCSPDQSFLVFNLTQVQEAPTWENGTTIIGGLEWECVNKLGSTVAIAVIIQGPTQKEEGKDGYYRVQTKPADYKDVYSNLTFIVNPPSNKRDESSTKKHNWNKDESTGFAVTRIPLASSNCNSQNLSPETQEFCDNGGNFSASAVCSNCWMTHEFTLSYSAGCRGFLCLDSYAQLNTLGKVEANLEVELETQGLFSAYNRPSFKIPVVGFDFHVVALEFYLEPALEMSTSFLGQGKARFGTGLTSSYQGEYGTDGFDTRFYNGKLFQTPSSLNANGHATAKLGLNISPTAHVSIASVISAQASVTVGPYIQADADISVPELLRPRNTLPLSPVSFPTSTATCSVPHVAEYNVTYGLEVTADASYSALFDLFSNSKHWNLYQSTYGLTSGCLGAVNNNGSSPSRSAQVNLYFPATSTVKSISLGAFSKLLSLDLTKILGVDFAAFGNITIQSQNLFGKSFYVVSVTFLESDFAVGSLSAAEQLKEISQDTSKISQMSSSLSVTNQMVDKPSDTKAGQPAGSNGLSSSAGIALPCLISISAVLSLLLLNVLVYNTQ